MATSSNALSTSLAMRLASPQTQKCAIGSNVARIVLPGDQNHFTTPPVSQQFFVPWTQDRFAGKPLENGCPQP